MIFLVIKPSRGRAILREGKHGFGRIHREWKFDADTPMLRETLMLAAKLEHEEMVRTGKTYARSSLLGDEDDLPVAEMSEEECLDEERKLEKARLLREKREWSRPGKNGRIIHKSGGL